MTSALNLSLLARGVGEVKRNGSEKIDVILEPNDYYNFTQTRLYLPPIHSQGRSRPNAALYENNNLHLPKTFITRKGALLLFSEDFAQKARDQEPGSHYKKHRVASAFGELDLHTVEDLANSILSYGSAGGKGEVNLHFVKEGQTQRLVRPGFSARRYLSKLTRSFDETFLKNLMSKGYVSEKSLFQTNILLPNLKKRINDDLSHMPAPYRIMRQMLLAPGMLSGFSFYRQQTDGSQSELSTLNEDGDADHEQQRGELKIVEIKDGEMRSVEYGDLPEEQKKNVLADLLVKSAISHALEKQKQVIQSRNQSVEDDEDNMLIVSGRGSLRSDNKEVQQFDMAEAVRSYIQSQVSDHVQDEITEAIRSKKTKLSTRKQVEDVASARRRKHVGGDTDRQSAQRDTREYEDGFSSTTPVLPPIRHSKGLIEVPHGKDTEVGEDGIPFLHVEPPTPQNTSLDDKHKRMKKRATGRKIADAYEKVEEDFGQDQLPKESPRKEQHRKVKNLKLGREVVSSQQVIESPTSSVASKGVYLSPTSVFENGSESEHTTTDGPILPPPMPSFRGKALRAGGAPKVKDRSSRHVLEDVDKQKGSVVVLPGGDIVKVGGTVSGGEQLSYTARTADEYTTTDYDSERDDWPSKRGRSSKSHQQDQGSVITGSDEYSGESTSSPEQRKDEASVKMESEKPIKSKPPSDTSKHASKPGSEDGKPDMSESVVAWSYDKPPSRADNDTSTVTLMGGEEVVAGSEKIPKESSKKEGKKAKERKHGKREKSSEEMEQKDQTEKQERIRKHKERKERSKERMVADDPKGKPEKKRKEHSESKERKQKEVREGKDKKSKLHPDRLKEKEKQDPESKPKTKSSSIADVSQADVDPYVTRDEIYTKEIMYESSEVESEIDEYTEEEDEEGEEEKEEEEVPVKTPTPELKQAKRKKKRNDLQTAAEETVVKTNEAKEDGTKQISKRTHRKKHKDRADNEAEKTLTATADVKPEEDPGRSKHRKKDKDKAKVKEEEIVVEERLTKREKKERSKGRGRKTKGDPVDEVVVEGVIPTEEHKSKHHRHQRTEGDEGKHRRRSPKQRHERRKERSEKDRDVKEAQDHQRYHTGSTSPAPRHHSPKRHRHTKNSEAVSQSRDDPRSSYDQEIHQSMRQHDQPRLSQDLLSLHGSRISHSGYGSPRESEQTYRSRKLSEDSFVSSEIADYRDGHKDRYDSGSTPPEISEEELVQHLSDQAHRIAAAILSRPGTGFSLTEDAQGAGKLWLDMTPRRRHSSDQSRVDELQSGKLSVAEEYKTLLKDTINSALLKSQGDDADLVPEDADIDEEVLRAIAQQDELGPDDLEVTENEEGRQVVRIKSSRKEAIREAKEQKRSQSYKDSSQKTTSVTSVTESQYYDYSDSPSRTGYSEAEPSQSEGTRSRSKSQSEWAPGSSHSAATPVSRPAPEEPIKAPVRQPAEEPIKKQPRRHKTKETSPEEEPEPERRHHKTKKHREKKAKDQVPVETPVETPVEIPVETPVETPVDEDPSVEDSEYSSVIVEDAVGLDSESELSDSSFISSTIESTSSKTGRKSEETSTATVSEGQSEKRERTQSRSKSSGTKEDTKEEFVVRTVHDNSELQRLYGPVDTPPPRTKESKKPRVPPAKSPKKPKKKAKAEKKKVEKKPVQSDKDESPTRDISQKSAKTVSETSVSLGMSETESIKTTEHEEEMEFVIIRDEFSDSEPEEEEPKVKSVASSKLKSTAVPSSEDYSDVDSDYSDSYEVHTLKQTTPAPDGSLHTVSSKEARAAERAARANKKREEVERKRREREEQMKRQKEAMDEREKLQRELEEERRRKEEERRMQREREEEERMRQEQEELDRERRRRLEAERERKMREEYARKLEQMKKQKLEDDRKRRELAEQRQREEEERRRQEEEMLAAMNENERMEYLRKKAEEEERRRIELEEQRKQEAEEMAKLEAEARYLAEQMALKQAEMERRLQFNRSLHLEAHGLEHTLNITEAFTWSYFELLQWLGLDLPDFEKMKSNRF